MILNSITWDVSREMFSLGPITVYWYGALFASAILLAFYIVNKIFKHENCPENWSEKLFVYGSIGLIVGARLGHCLFYGADGDFWHYYRNPHEILMIWRGGLSSHGGAIGLLIAMYLYNRNVLQKGYLWILDRLVIGVAIGGALIRFGNLMNSEIFGGPTTLPWGFEFVRSAQWHAIGVPVHPTQIYEMIYCIVTFAVCMWLYWKKDAHQKPGFIFGIFLIGIFLSRFLLEFIKNDQEAFEAYMMLNMGQLLSIPFIIGGVYFIFAALRKKTK